MIALLLGLMFFPSVVAFVKTPILSAHHVLFYAAWLAEICTRWKNVKESLSTIPLKIPIFFLILGYFATGFEMSGNLTRNMYQGVRIFFDIFGPLFLTYHLARSCNREHILKFLYLPILIFCGFGIIEAAIGANIPYKIIGKAFPVYNGYYNLNSNIGLSEDWRIRICITTAHPTTLGTILSTLFFLYLPTLKETFFKKSEKIFLYSALFLTLFLSGSRTAWLCVAGFSAFYFLLRSPLWLKIISGTFFAILFSFGMATLISSFSIEGRGSSLSLRETQLLFTLVQLQEKPLFGHGFNYIHNTIIERDTYGDQVGNSEIGVLESIVFFILIEQGIIGLLAYLFFFACLIFQFFRHRYLGAVAEQGLLTTLSLIAFLLISGRPGGNDYICLSFIGFCLGTLSISKAKDKEPQNSKVIR
ncbi:MAG: O-antigen ligase family protein [Fibrobacter sp.]|nr:O-antigen ligase family protein [Fibrobacter sp.]